MTDETPTKAAVYLRVSSEEQRERQTIETQREHARRYCDLNGIAIHDVYADDGVTGTLPLGERPEGARLVRDAEAGRFSLVLFYKLDRPGRSPRVISQAVDQLEAVGVLVKSMTEPFETTTPAGRLMLNTLSGFAGFERETFLERSAEGTNRAARAGRPLGGIAPYGYRVVGLKHTACWILDDQAPLWQDETAADIVRWIYRLLAYERWSCYQVAIEFNRLGVPTTDQRDKRVRKKARQPEWRPSRIAHIVKNPIYKGEYQYGRRSKKRRSVIVSTMPALVTPEIWAAAQASLKLHQIGSATGERRAYLLKSVIRCEVCGLGYCGVNGREGVWWYRCNGQIRLRGSRTERCEGKSLRADLIEPLVWADIERFLREPGDLIAELQAEAASRATGQEAVREAERLTLETKVAQLESARERALDLYTWGQLDRTGLEAPLVQIDEAAASARTKLTALLGPTESAPLTPDLLSQLRARLDAGLDIATRQEIVQILVRRIRVRTTVEGRRKAAAIAIEYRFSAHLGVVPDFRDIPASQNYTRLVRMLEV